MRPVKRRKIARPRNLPPAYLSRLPHCVLTMNILPFLDQKNRASLHSCCSGLRTWQGAWSRCSARLTDDSEGTVTSLKKLRPIDIGFIDCMCLDNETINDILRTKNIVRLSLDGCINLCETIPLHLPKTLQEFESVNSMTIGDSIVPMFKNLPFLQKMVLTTVMVKDAMVWSALASCPVLMDITIELINGVFTIDEEEIDHDRAFRVICLNPVPIRRMALRYWRTSSNAFDALPHMAGLTSLSLETCRLTDDHLAWIGQLSGLKAIRLTDNPYITDKGLSELSLMQVEKLELDKCNRLTGKVIDENWFPSLVTLSIRECWRFDMTNALLHLKFMKCLTYTKFYTRLSMPLWCILDARRDVCMHPVLPATFEEWLQ